MNDILKYWPIHFRFEGRMMSVPLGEIVNISADAKETIKAAAVIVVRDGQGTDTWRTENSYNSVMKQWAEAMGSVHGHKQDKVEVQP
jgi:hypothetical protein